MVQLGSSKEKKVELPKDATVFVDPAFFKIDIEINGKVFK